MSAASDHEASTVLTLGARGKHRGAPFALAGRTCVQSDSGGVWNEWTLAYDDGRQAFLAETAGGFTLFFERPIAPSFDSLAVGQPLGTGFLVVERGQARRIARWGDVPESPRTYRYADLSSASGETATIDYGSGERSDVDVFVGTTVRLADLGLVAIDVGGIDVAIADRERRAHCVARPRPGAGAEHAERHAWDRDALIRNHRFVQRVCRHGCF